MTDYDALSKDAFIEAQRLIAECNIFAKNVIFVASMDAIRYICTDPFFEAQPNAYGQIFHAHYRGHEICGIPGENFFRPVVIYDNVLHSMPDGTLVIRRQDYNDNQLMTLTGVFRNPGNDDCSLSIEYFGRAVFNNDAPVAIEDGALYHERPIKDLYGIDV